MHDKIKALKKENNELRKTIESLENDEADITAFEDAEKKRMDEEHAAHKKEMRDAISETKVELEKIMSTKLII